MGTRKGRRGKTRRGDKLITPQRFRREKRVGESGKEGELDTIKGELQRRKRGERRRK